MSLDHHTHIQLVDIKKNSNSFEKLHEIQKRSDDQKNVLKGLGGSSVYFAVGRQGSGLLITICAYPFQGMEFENWRKNLVVTKKSSTKMESEAGLQT